MTEAELEARNSYIGPEWSDWKPETVAGKPAVQATLTVATVPVVPAIPAVTPVTPATRMYDRATVRVYSIFDCYMDDDTVRPAIAETAEAAFMALSIMYWCAIVMLSIPALLWSLAVSSRQGDGEGF